MTNQRNRCTREQMKREKIKTGLIAAALIVMWVVMTALAIGTWAEHPGEQPVDGQTYIAAIQMEGDPFENAR